MNRTFRTAVLMIMLFLGMISLVMITINISKSFPLFLIMCVFDVFAFFLMVELTANLRDTLMLPSITSVKNMSGSEFEEYCAQLLVENGFSDIEITPKSRDHGIDILAIRRGRIYAIQCKRYSRNIGNKAIQEVFTGKAYYGADIAAIMTNQDFTSQARAEAERLHIRLWGKPVLEKMLRNC